MLLAICKKSILCMVTCLSAHERNWDMIFLSVQRLLLNRYVFWNFCSIAISIEISQFFKSLTWHLDREKFGNQLIGNGQNGAVKYITLYKIYSKILFWLIPQSFWMWFSIWHTRHIITIISPLRISIIIDKKVSYQTTYIYIYIYIYI